MTPQKRAEVKQKLEDIVGAFAEAGMGPHKFYYPADPSEDYYEKVTYNAGLMAKIESFLKISDHFIQKDEFFYYNCYGEVDGEESLWTTMATMTMKRLALVTIMAMLLLIHLMMLTL